MNDITKLGLTILAYDIVLWVALGISAWLANSFPSSLTVNNKNNVKPIKVKKTITAEQSSHRKVA